MRQSRRVQLDSRNSQQLSVESDYFGKGRITVVCDAPVARHSWTIAGGRRKD